MAKVEYFRYWCQKILPLVYDDSLSYYELLGKVIKYLNDVVDAVNENTDNVSTMRSELTSFEANITSRQDSFESRILNIVQQLESFMNNYFDSLDVQTEINNKLDEMASDGTLTSIITPLVPDIVATWLSEHITPTTPAIDTSLTVSGAGADSKTVGDLFKTCIKSGTVSSTDLNDYTSNGFYFLGYSTDYTNCPIAKSTRRLLTVYHVGQLTFQNISDFTNTKQSYTRVYASNTWTSWKLSGFGNVEPSSTNLNDITEEGYYFLTYATSYTNSPIASNNRRFLFVYNHASSIIQMIVSTEPLHKIYVRAYTSGTGWMNWYSLNFSNYEVEDTDLNNLTNEGYYFLSYSTNYTHAPISVGRRYLFVYAHGASKVQFMYTHEPRYSMHVRYYTSGSGWSEWVTVIEQPIFDNEVVTSVVEVGSHITSSPKARLRVMSYNVANYNHNSAVYIPDEKIHNFRSMLNEYNCDFIGTQEDALYIDNSSKSPLDWLYHNMIYKAGQGGVAIYSNITPLSGGIYKLAGDVTRLLRVAYYTILGDKKLAVISCHPVAGYSDYSADSAEAVALRLTEYTSIYNFVKGTGTLVNYSTNIAESFPNDVDYIIICGDFNTITSDDKTNLKTVFSDMPMCNGEWLGWLKTGYNYSAPNDNIIVSNNISIRKVKTLNTWYDKLYSDHAPIYAELDLL